MTFVTSYAEWLKYKTDQKNIAFMVLLFKNKCPFQTLIACKRKVSDDRSKHIMKE